MLRHSRMSSTSPAVKSSSRRFSFHRKGSTAKEKIPAPVQSPSSQTLKAVNGNGNGNGSVNGPSSVPGPSSMPSRRELEQVFKKFDVNNDGKISSSELRALMASMGQKSSEEEVGSIMKEADTDGDGFINFDEFYDANTRGVNGNRVRKDLESAFKMYDLDKSGTISVEELYKVLKNLGEVSSLQDCRQMIKGVDKNADGCISFEEFMTMMSSPHP